MPYDEQHLLRRIQRHTFQGNRYRIIVEKTPQGCIGECDAHDTTNREIRINPEIKGRQLLQTLIDEAIHQCVWVDVIDNEKVDQMSESISKFLWKAGYRVVLPEEEKTEP